MYDLADLQGVYNLRDVGVYKLSDSKEIKKGVVFRSDDLSSLTSEDLSLLEMIPLVNIIDFRGEDERMTAPDKLPSTVKNVYNLSIDVGNVGLEIFKEDPAGVMRYIYELLVLDYQETYKIFFDILAESNEPVLFHCTAGKDRTGFAAAMFLSVLGFDKDTIYSDYLLSKELIEPKYADFVIKNPNLAPLMTVDKSYLDSAYGIIEKHYGSTDRFIKNQLKVDVNFFKQKFLE